ncbi:MAG: nucleoside deaminase [Deltaproteobacteria bacterium]|jgi:tRNA(adenine34) deaminase|nr:nucleoside deaminase [Deltaproteobacteria bacterium]MCL6120153.1 nucleoside deaminase [Deltaproteobacteria bacterium]
MNKLDDKYFMDLALKEAEKALNNDEVPVGAVITSIGGNVISSAFNTVESDISCIMHAEINAILAAQKKLHNWRLDECSLYVTLEPCIMCCGAILLSRIGRVVYGAADPKGGVSSSILSGKIELTGGIMDEESSMLLKSFFKSKRENIRYNKSADEDGS